MTDFLLELRSEEIPARMQAGARATLERLFREAMSAAGVGVGEIAVWSTPRRLALIARDVPEATAAVSEEIKGPRSSAPEQALEGFLRKTGLTEDQLTERDGVWFAVIDKPGRATAQVLAEAIPAIVRAFPWPKSQRWGAASISSESLRWVRPLSGIVALLGDALVECEVGDVRSGYATKGHRFHAPGEITIGSAADYRDKLRDCHVIVDHAEREALIREGARAVAAEAGLVLVEDEGLVVENAGLTEWPVPLLGRFDEAFLEVPPEVIQLTARTNQKYFVCEQQGKLANAFICTANIAASDGGGAIVAGNRKVLAARLSDARFFWEQDRKKTLTQHAEGLARITFHEKLGTVAEKVQRVANLAEWLAGEGIVPNCDPVLARQAAELCKADLVTEMVGEFPELQGLMGGYYARAEGLPDAVADAIRDHYKPVGQGDEVPTAPVTVAVSLADKLDTLAGFFATMQFPTGSKDPFALRRQMIGVINIIETNRLLLPLHHVGKIARNSILTTLLPERWAVDADDDENYILYEGDEKLLDSVLLYPYEASRYTVDYDPEQLVLIEQYDRKQDPPVYFDSAKGTAESLTQFMLDRLRVRLREAEIRHDVIEALIPKPPEDIALEWLILELQLSVEGKVHLRKPYTFRPSDQIIYIDNAAHALNSELSKPAGKDAMHAYRRATRFLADAVIEESIQDFREVGAPEEMLTLAAWLEELDGKLKTSLVLRNVEGAVAAIAEGKPIIDAFCDHVTVNDPNPAKRAARLALLARFRDAVHSVADFSRIEG